MKTFANKVAEARGVVGEPAWTEQRARAVLQKLLQARAQRESPRRSWLAFIAFVPVAAAVVVLALRAPGPHERQIAAQTRVLHDGSRAESLTPPTQLALLEDSPNLALFDLQSGGGRFEVVPNKARRFRVEAGAVSVEALGTVFIVSHEQPAQVRVAVVVGRVAVRWPGGNDVLSQGQEGLYPPVDHAQSPPQVPDLDEPPAPVAEAAPPEAPAQAKLAKPARGARSDNDWRALARQKAFARSFAAMSAAGSQSVRDVPQELLMAADVARMAGHPEVAVRHLERILEAHVADTRASVAAFTLGRLHLQGAKAKPAAIAFEHAFTLQPQGALAEPALARAAFAWKNAGVQSAARAAAQTYLQRFPQGPQAKELRRLLATP